MLIQLFAAIAYSIFAIVVLAFLKSYKLSVRNVFSFVFGGAIGFLVAGLSGKLFTDENGIIIHATLICRYLGLLTLGLFGGSYIGLKYIGVKSNGT